MFEPELKAFLDRDTPPDTASWEVLRQQLRAVESQWETQSKLLAQFESIFRVSNIAYCLSDLAGNIYDVNERGAAITGWTRAELIAQSVIRLQCYADPRERERLVEIFLREQRLRDAEVRVRTRAGDERIIVMNWDPFEIEGQPLILSTFVDVTEAKRSEALLRELHARAERQAREFALLHEARTVLARSIDLTTMIRAIVDAIATTLGYTLVSLYFIKNGKLVLQHYYGYQFVLHDIPLETGVMARSVRLKQPILLANVHDDPDFLEAVPGIVSEIAVPLMVGDEVVGVLNVESKDDMTLGEADLKLIAALAEHVSLAIQRAQLYASLAESERREREQRLMAEALRDTAAGLNATLELETMLDLILNHLKRVMPPFQGVRVAFLAGSKARIVAQRGYPDNAFADRFDIALLEGAETMVSDRQVLINRDRWAAPERAKDALTGWVRSLIGAPISFNHRVIGVIYLDSDTPNSFRDKHADLLKAFADQAGIALQKAQLYKRLRRQTRMRLRQALEYGRRVSEMRSQFGIAISHEFRTPLTTIHTSADLLRLYDERLSPERRRELLAKINTQVKHLTHLLDDIMLLSRSELIGVQLNITTIDLDQVCRDVAADIQWIAGDKHRIIYFGDNLCQNARLDEDLTRRVLINLLTNAVKYSPEGGKILFTLSRVDDEAIIEVTDNGIGIPTSDIGHLFQTFHRAGNVGSIPGTGLGLTLVKQAVELQGGSINVHSTEGIGSTFTVRLPITERSPSKD